MELLGALAVTGGFSGLQKGDFGSGACNGSAESSGAGTWASAMCGRGVCVKV